MTDETKLKPCPFCGAPAGVMKAAGVYQAFCSDLSCLANGTYNTKDCAIVAWNTRSTVPAEIVQAMADALGTCRDEVHEPKCFDEDAVEKALSAFRAWKSTKGGA